MFLQPRTVQQVATLPFVVIDGTVELLLITSRRRRRWIVPKGWPGRARTLAEAAAREAAEEAGVVGPVQVEPLGEYTYDKRMLAGYRVRCHVFVYPLLVREHHVAWPERRQRRLRWVSLAEAANLVDDHHLAELLGGLAVNDGAPLLDFMHATAA